MLALQLPSWLALLLTAALSTAAAPATAQRGSSDVGIVVGAGIAASMSGAAASRPVGVVLFEQQAMQSDSRLRRAVLEARRYMYELSGELPELVPVGAEEGGLRPFLSAQLASRHGVLVAPEARLAALHPGLAAAGVPTPATVGSHFVQRLQLERAASSLVVCSGVDGISTLYAVYCPGPPGRLSGRSVFHSKSVWMGLVYGRAGCLTAKNGGFPARAAMLEALGVRFRNHGDIVPRGGRGAGLGALLVGAALAPTRQWSSPNMALRGSQPFFDFPAGPDWWGVEEYKWFTEQMAKQKMNFMGLHTYKNEPTVWQDSNTSANYDAASGNVTRVPTYPDFQYTYTTTMGGWGNSKTGAGWTGTPGATSDYLLGSGQMYHEDCYTTPALMGDASICPNPRSESAQARVFNNVGAMLKEVFTVRARPRLLSGLSVSLCK
jgi:hypothetical protein